MKNSARVALLFFGDLVMLTAAFFAMLAIAFSGNMTREIIQAHVVPFAIIGVLWLCVFFIFNLYNTQLVKPTIPHLQHIGIASLVAMAMSVIVFYTVPSFGITPKTNLVIFGGIFLLFFLLWRRIFYTIFASYFKKSVVIITDTKNGNEHAEELVHYITTYPQSGFFIKGIYSSLQDFFEKQKGESVGTLIISKSVLGNPGDFKLLYNTSSNILDLAYAYEDMLGKIPVHSIDEAWFLHNVRSTDKYVYENIARAMSIIGAFILLVVTFPFLCIVAIAVKWGDRGEIFYTHLRVGRNGNPFNLYKFRSMVVDADKNGAEWTEKNDPRITKVGKIIRKLHIDEVPQLWNVLRGDMALVGPRPELPSFVKKLEVEIPHYNLRHIIMPGFTGWAQIKYRNARGVSESKEKFEYDLYYTKNRNVFMDIGILLRTMQIIFTHPA